MIRWALHTAHAAATVALLVTGFLIEFPEARARLVGGFGPQISAAHDWTGVAFMVAPLLALLIARRALFQPKEADGAGALLFWRRLHVVGSLGAGLLVSVTGMALWIADMLPTRLADGTALVHVGLAWLFAGALVAHLVAVMLGRLAAVARQG
ncbi:MAG: hypothetical protein U0807_12220 [Candidatus Binatia bacterium]